MGDASPWPKSPNRAVAKSVSTAALALETWVPDSFSSLETKMSKVTSKIKDHAAELKRRVLLEFRIEVGGGPTAVREYRYCNSARAKNQQRQARPTAPLNADCR
jgi:hypothetical protein